MKPFSFTQCIHPYDIKNNELQAHARCAALVARRLSFINYFPLLFSLMNISKAAVIEGACTVGASKSKRSPASRTACAVVEPNVPI